MVCHCGGGCDAERGCGDSSFQSRAYVRRAPFSAVAAVGLAAGARRWRSFVVRAAPRMDALRSIRTIATRALSHQHDIVVVAIDEPSFSEMRTAVAVAATPARAR